MIKFNLYNVTNTTTKQKAKVYYSLDGRIDGRKCVTIRAKGYGNELGQFFKGQVSNNTDMMTDYFDKDTVRLFETDKLYKAARATAERLIAKRGY